MASSTQKNKTPLTSAPEKPWYHHITLDILFRVGQKTILHPFVMWMVPLSLRAQVTPYSHPAFIWSSVYAAFLTVLWVLSSLDKKIAYGPPREVDLAEEVVVVTGGSSGLGQLIAEVYGIRGAAVAVLDVEPLEDSEGKGVQFYKCDVGDAAQVEDAAKRIEKELGAPTILINNAGVVNGKSLLDLTNAEIERNLQVNLLAHFYTIKAFLPRMLEEGYGTIVTVSSVLGHFGCANLSDYSAAKSALIALHASLRAELQYSSHPAARNIRTILVTPGQLSTPLFGRVQTPSAFLAPVVPPVEIAKDIIRLVDAGDSGEVTAPIYARLAGWWHVLPPGVRHVVRRLSGIDIAMGKAGQSDEVALDKAG